MTKTRATVVLLCSLMLTLMVRAALAADGDEWRIHSQEANGDIHFFDETRMDVTDDSHRVWTRIRYNTSVMGAMSYQSLLEVDCSERTVRTLQRTFFSDRKWEKPAMSTDKKEKPKRPIKADSAVGRLSEILCDQ
ncbi:MAG: surface-adhesin E family protein [Pseudomonadota bacterium]